MAKKVKLEPVIVEDDGSDLMTPTRIRRYGWDALVVRNEDDVGWAVEMRRVGDSEPALVGPWTMGRDKKNPKPLDIHAFNTLIKTASDVLARHAQAERDSLRKVFGHRRPDGQSVRVTLEIVPDEFDPRAMIRCVDERTGDVLREGTVSAGFKLNTTSIEHYLASGSVD
jgi:hypothetical protein